MSDDREHPGVPSGYELLTGECYYKSGWVEVEWPGGMMSFNKPKGPKYCWLQWLGWSFYLYDKCQWWYNWKRSGNPEEDASFLSKMAAALPDFKMPSLPGLPSLSMPSLSMPSLSMPSMSMPSMSMPSMSMLKAKKFRKDSYIVYSYLSDKCTLKRSGKTFVLTTEKSNLYFENGETEEEKGYKVEFKAPNDEQADSWQTPTA